MPIPILDDYRSAEKGTTGAIQITQSLRVLKEISRKPGYLSEAESLW